MVTSPVRECDSHRQKPRGLRGKERVDFAVGLQCGLGCALRRVALCCDVLLRVALRRVVLRRVESCCIALCRVALCCDVLLRVVSRRVESRCFVLCRVPSL